MALTLPWLFAAVVTATVGVPRMPPARWVDGVVGRAINGTAQTMAARRGLRLVRPIPVRIIGRAQMSAARDVLSRIRRTPDQERDQLTLYDRLGLTLPPRLDGELSGSSPQDVSGLFDAASGRLLVGNWVDLEADRFAWARDVAQALLDRRFDLTRWLAPPGRWSGYVDSDALWARQALVMGDATTQALEFVDPLGAIPSPRALGQMIAEVRATIIAENAGTSPLLLGHRLFVELDGLTFVALIRGRTPWSVVDAVWRRPPQSSEQILHLDKYDRNEKPDDVASRLPARLRGGWRPTYRDTLGELGVRLFLARAVDDYRAERAATGWGGDCALLLAEAPVPPATAATAVAAATAARALAVDATNFVAWITTWDDDTDAADFAVQAASTLAMLAGTTASGVSSPSTSGRFRAVDPLGRVYALQLRGRAVGMLFAAPANAEEVLSELLSAAGGRAGHRAPPPQGRARSK